MGGEMDGEQRRFDWQCKEFGKGQNLDLGQCNGSQSCSRLAGRQEGRQADAVLPACVASSQLAAL